MQKKIGIVIPAANEEKTIKELYIEIDKQLGKLNVQGTVYIVLDTASVDKTRIILNQLSKKYTTLCVMYEPKNKSVVGARIIGFKKALKDGCDFIIEMDCGFSHLPQELYKFIHAFQEGYDCVFGIRPLWSNSYHVPLYRRFYSISGTLVSNFLLGTRYTDMTSGYEGFSRKALQNILKKPILSTDHFFQTEMRYKARTYKYLEVFITYGSPTPRVKWDSVKNSIGSLFKLFLGRFE